MKRMYKLALLAAIGLAGMTSAKAETGYDLIAGFTVASGNDVFIDLGSTVSYPGASVIYDGETWNLSTFLSAYNLNNVRWGIVGDAGSAVSGQTPQALWVTTAGITPPTVNGGSAWSSVDTAINGVLSNFGVNGQTSFSYPGQTATAASSTDNSWYVQTVTGPVFTDYINVYGDPNVTGLTSDTFWQVYNNNSAPTKLGTFTLNSSGVLTYHVASSTPTPPAPRIVSVTRSGNNSTIYFTTTNGTFTYVLYYTNSAGLNAPVTNWPSLPTTVTGNGLTNSLSDTTTAANRFYRVGVH